jgi:hypothetical protein
MAESCKPAARKTTDACRTFCLEDGNGQLDACKCSDNANQDMEFVIFNRKKNKKLIFSHCLPESCKPQARKTEQACQDFCGVTENQSKDACKCSDNNNQDFE